MGKSQVGRGVERAHTLFQHLFRFFSNTTMVERSQAPDNPTPLALQLIKACRHAHFPVQAQSTCKPLTAICACCIQAPPVLGSTTQPSGRPAWAWRLLQAADISDNPQDSWRRARCVHACAIISVLVSRVLHSQTCGCQHTTAGDQLCIHVRIDSGCQMTRV